MGQQDAQRVSISHGDAMFTCRASDFDVPIAPIRLSRYDHTGSPIDGDMIA